jgi:ABC-2 type transport system ATP-binding protein
MNDPVLEIRDLHFSYGNVLALDGFSMTVPRGAVCAFVGRNGAGKTTTFSVIAGFLRFGSGMVSVCGQRLDQFRKAGGMIGLLPQEVSFFEDRTISSQLVFLGRLSGLKKKEAAEEAERVLHQVSLLEQSSSYPDELSRGMKMRLGIAQAILACPPLILLDEPTAGLDPVVRSQFYDLIRELRQQTTFVISSHNLSELEALCDSVCMIEKGRLINSDTMDHLLHSEDTVYYRLGSGLFHPEILAKTFSDFIFTFEPDSRAFSVTGKKKPATTADINKAMLGWLLQNRVEILEVTPKASLHQKYMEQIGS